MGGGFLEGRALICYDLTIGGFTEVFTTIGEGGYVVTPVK